MDVVEDDAGPEPVHDEGQAEPGDGPGPGPDGSTAAPADAGATDGAAPSDAAQADAAQADAGATDDAAPPTDAGDDPDHGSDAKDPLRFNNWMKRSATGAVMTGIAVGLQQALQLPRQEPAFVIEASGEPHDPNRPIDLHFDPDSPSDTVAIIRRPAPKGAPEETSPPA